MVKTKSFNLAIYQKGHPDSHQVALVLPGKLETKDYPHMRSHVDFLADQGYLALSFDPPGTWQSEGDISAYTVTNYLRAIHELIEHFGNRPTLLVGHSRGGSMAMLGALRNPFVTRFVSIMSQARASRLDGEVVNGCTISVRDLPNDPKKFREFRLPLSYYEDARQYDLLLELQTCTKPKLFIFATKDAIVAPDLVKEAYEASAEPKKLESIESDHDYRRYPELIEQINRMIGIFLAWF